MVRGIIVALAALALSGCYTRGQVGKREVSAYDRGYAEAMVGKERELTRYQSKLKQCLELNQFLKDAYRHNIGETGAEPWLK